MAQIAPLASLISGVAGLASAQGQQRQAQAQAQAQAQGEALRGAQLQAQSVEAQRQRREALARTVASARARLAAGGVSAGEGSAAALVGGIEEEARARNDADAQQLNFRLASGRSSLLDNSGNLTPFVRAGTTLASSLGTSVRSLLNF
jgi:hypothetical protein